MKLHLHSRDIRRKGEDKDNLKKNLEKNLREKLGETAEKSNLDQKHGIGSFKEDNNKCKPITVKFSRYNVPAKVFKNNKKLKGNFFSITETLTALRMKKPTKARNPFGLTNV